MQPQPLRQTIQSDLTDGLLLLDDAQRAQAQERRAIVAAWRTMCGVFVSSGRPRGEATEVFLQGHPGLSKSVLYAWAKRATDPDPTAIIDRRSTALRCQPGEVSEAAWVRFKAIWLTPQQRTVKQCWAIVMTEAHENGWRWPALRTVQRKVEKELPPIKSDVYRLGEREWDKRWGPRLRRDYSQYRSGQIWVGDFHICDCFCRRSETDWRIMRPLAAGWLDLRSRIVAAFRIVEREDQNSVLLSFKEGVLRWGPPQEVVIDNGKSYRAKGISGGRPARLIENEEYVRSVLGALEVQVHFSIPYNPDSKPIERWFRTFEDGFGKTLGTYCGGDNKSQTFKGAYRFACDHPGKCPTVAEYAQLAGEWIEKAYHNTPHTGDGMEGLSPLQAFDRFDPVPRVVCPEGVLDLLLMRPTKPVKVTRFGVRFQGIEYGQNDPRLFPLQGQEVILRVDPSMADYVVVCDLTGKPICKAINNWLALTGTTQDDVANGQAARNRSRKLARQVREDGLHGVMDSITDAAIHARLERAKEEEATRLKATGTEGRPCVTCDR